MFNAINLDLKIYIYIFVVECGMGNWIIKAALSPKTNHLGICRGRLFLSLAKALFYCLKNIIITNNNIFVSIIFLILVKANDF